MTNEYLRELLDQYLKIFPDEVQDLEVLRKQLADLTSIVDRRNATGHATASGMVLWERKVLLIFHNKLQKYLQPGGHIENDLELWCSAEREIMEETGVRVSLHPWHAEHGGIPIQIDTHVIPFHPKKMELEHYHHDFCFVFRAVDPTPSIQLEEVSAFKWAELSDEFEGRLLKLAVKKIKDLGLG